MSHTDDVFMRVFGAILLMLMLLGLLAFVVANLLVSGRAPDPRLLEASLGYIKPVGQVAVAGRDTLPVAPVVQAAVAAAPKSGKEVVASACAACHTTGAAGAPKIGDKTAWEGRFPKGLDVLTQSAIKGLGAMPPRGGNPALSDAEIQAAVSQMLQDTGFTVAAPAESAAAAPAPTPEVAAPAGH
jgi:cytochrome c5